MSKTSRLVATAFITLGLVLFACGGAQEGKASGTVVAVHAEEGEITIDHGDIPGLMKAMTMRFEVEDPALLEGVSVGDEVRFEIRYADGDYTVTALTPKSRGG